MKIILTKDVDKLGNLGDTRDVKDGFAVNWLFPQGLAVQAESREGRRLAAKRAYLDQKAAKAQQANQQPRKPAAKRVARTSARAKQDSKKVAQFRRKVGTPTTEYSASELKKEVINGT